MYEVLGRMLQCAYVFQRCFPFFPNPGLFRLPSRILHPLLLASHTPMFCDGCKIDANISFIYVAGHEYGQGNAPAHHHQPPPPPPPPGQAELSSPTSATPRYAQNFYAQYPQHPNRTVGGSSMPSVHDAMDPMHGHASTLATHAHASLKDEDEESKRTLFGDLPESKRRKFILVEDQQRGTRVRVRVMLDQVKMDDMPDAHLRINAVFPRSYYPRQMRSPPGSPGGRGIWDDEDDVEGTSGTAPTRGKTLVSVPLMDGSEAKLPIPRMTKSRRAKEIALNELGYRMAWGQARTFNGRTLFLQRSCKWTRRRNARGPVGLTDSSGRLSQQDAEHHDLRRTRRDHHRISFRNPPG